MKLNESTYVYDTLTAKFSLEDENYLIQNEHMQFYKNNLIPLEMMIQ